MKTDRGRKKKETGRTSKTLCIFLPFPMYLILHVFKFLIYNPLGKYASQQSTFEFENAPQSSAWLKSHVILAKSEW